MATRRREDPTFARPATYIILLDLAARKSNTSTVKNLEINDLVIRRFSSCQALRCSETDRLWSRLHCRSKVADENTNSDEKIKTGTSCVVATLYPSPLPGVTLPRKWGGESVPHSVQKIDAIISRRSLDGTSADRHDDLMEVLESFRWRQRAATMGSDLSFLVAREKPMRPDAYRDKLQLT